MIRAGLRRYVVPPARRLPQSLQVPLRTMWHFVLSLSRPLSTQMDHPDYSLRAEAESAIFSGQEHIHDLPPIYHYWSNTYLRPKLEAFGFSNPEQFFAHNLGIVYAKVTGRPARFISIGAGNCDTEIHIARVLVEQGLNDFTLDCLELNPAMLERGRALAAEHGLSTQIATLQGDFNRWRPTQTYDAVIANQSLHHVSNLEGLFDAIAQALAPHGRFITSDIIGRNGHQRWPEALAIVQEFWRELPKERRYNLQLHRRERKFRNWDNSRESFEGIRAQDILPLLIERFDFEFFLAYANVIDPFIDRSFGPHFNIDSADDRAFIDRIHARDEAEILAGNIKPTHMMAVMYERKLQATHEDKALL